MAMNDNDNDKDKEAWVLDILHRIGSLETTKVVDVGMKVMKLQMDYEKGKLEPGISEDQLYLKISKMIEDVE
jgi:hypothetical protein